MATPIPGAYPSPRIDKGVLRWYEGDTFSIVLRFDLKDQISTHAPAGGATAGL